MEQYRSTAGFVASAGAAVEAVGVAIIPGDGETLKVTGLTLSSDLAGAGGPIDILVQESVNAGVAWATIFAARLAVANGLIEISDMRFICMGNNRQARGSNNLQYRLAVDPDAAASNYTAALRGRTEK